MSRPMFFVGQRYASDAEPELGLGILVALNSRHIDMAFPAADTTRRYSRDNPPLRRILYRPGDVIHDKNNNRLPVTSVTLHPETGLVVYGCGSVMITEKDVADTAGNSEPLQRLLNGKVCANMEFNARTGLLHYQSDILRSPVRGFTGARIELLPHQLSIAGSVSSRATIRVMLADETGLGKTIEACLILHRLILTGRINRVLVLVPAHLMHQWFVELWRRFNLRFTLLTRETFQEAREGENPFACTSLAIAGIEALATEANQGNWAIEAGWDMVVVDESHHLKPGEPGFAIVRRLAAGVHHVLFLTATPEQNGRENHFACLQLLDPERYRDFGQYEEEAASYQTVLDAVEQAAGKAEADLPPWGKIPVDQLVDVFGVGRILFRNTRGNIAGFPERHVHLAPLENSPDNPRISWLAGLLLAQPHDKFLVLCATQKTAEQIQKGVQKIIRISVALFHEEMTLLQRDRNAAWFGEQAGARLLVCSEMGSEGRNFQFCHSLILYDLPFNPERIEQRIGRLDRIGQKSAIHIHVPYIRNSAEEFLCLWYHKGLDLFKRNVPAAGRVFENLREELTLWCGDSPPGDRTAFLPDITFRTRELCSKFASQITDPRDKLLESLSFQAGKADGMIAGIDNPATRRATEIMMGRLLRSYGITVEEAGTGLHRLQTEYVTDPAFPLPRNSDSVITFSREAALVREDVDFITPDHPMLLGALDLFLSSEQGSGSFCIWKDRQRTDTLVELIYVLECVAPAALYPGRFLPPNAIRLVVDKKGADVTARYPQTRILEESVNRSPFLDKNRMPESISLVRTMMEAGQIAAQKQARIIIGDAVNVLTETIDREMARLETLEKKGSANLSREKEMLGKERIDLTGHLQNSRIRLDAIRIIWQNVESSEDYTVPKRGRPEKPMSEFDRDIENSGEEVY